MIDFVKKYSVWEYLVIFILIFSFNSLFYHTHDFMLDFTHVYSISNGLTIYKDFNIVIGPIYPTLIALFLVIFGKNMFVFHIIHSIIVVGIYYLIKKNNKNTLSFFVFIILHRVLFSKYNVFCLLLFYIIYYLEIGNYKYKDYLIGFLLGITLFTKISIGVFLIIPTLILYYKKPKVIIKRLFLLLFVSLSIIIWMYFMGNLDAFFNYTILGLFDFAGHTSNFFLDNILYIILLIISFIYLMIHLKNNKYLSYMICFLIMSYSIFDESHVLLALFPTIVYVFDSFKQNTYLKKIIYVLSIFLFLVSIINVIIGNNYHKMDCKMSYCSQDKIIQNTFKRVHMVNLKLNKDYLDYYKYYFNDYAYFYKLDLKEDITPYDYIWVGNMGYHGEERIIKEIEKTCKNEKCLFVIDEDVLLKFKKSSFISYKILDYVNQNYKKKEYCYYKNATIYVNQ